MIALAFVLSLLIGASLGLIGSGGSIITVPMLVYIAGIAPKEAATMSLAIVGATSLVGLILCASNSSLDYAAVLWISLGGICGAYPGAWLSHHTPPHILLGVFGGFMLVAGARMLARRNSLPTVPNRSISLLIIAGIVISFLTSFLGIGGGFIIIPILVLLTGANMKSAVGTSLAIIVVNCVYGLAAKLLDGNTLNLPLTAGFACSAAVGMIVAHRFAGRVPERALRIAFAWLIVLIGAGVVSNAIYVATNSPVAVN